MNTGTASTDNQLLTSFKAGEEPAFNYYFKQYYKRLFFFAIRLIHDEDAAEDIVTETFLKAWNRRSSIISEAHLCNYLYIAVRHACKDWVAKQNTFHKNKAALALLYDNSELCIQEHIIRTETIHQLYTTLEQLPPACRAVFKKLYIEGKSMKEAAIDLNLATSTVQNQKLRGIKIIRKKLLTLK